MRVNHGRLILVVDDDQDIRESLRAALEDAGYGVLSAAHGDQALSLLAENPRLPDLILLDLMMPIKDGWQFRAAQREDPKWRGIPVVIISAGGNVEQKALNLEARGWLRKPIQLQVLLGEVRRVLILR